VEGLDPLAPLVHLVPEGQPEQWDWPEQPEWWVLSDRPVSRDPRVQ
jgi:hypothetical protein